MGLLVGRISIYGQTKYVVMPYISVTLPHYLPICNITHKFRRCNSQCALTIQADGNRWSRFGHVFPSKRCQCRPWLLNTYVVSQYLNMRAHSSEVGPTVLFVGEVTRDKVQTLSIDVKRREVRRDRDRIVLSRTQFDILSVLARDPGTVSTRAEIVAAVWGPAWRGSSNILDVHIGHLRRRLGDRTDRPHILLNVRGVGFRLNASG